MADATVEMIVVCGPAALGWERPKEKYMGNRISVLAVSVLLLALMPAKSLSRSPFPLPRRRDERGREFFV